VTRPIRIEVIETNRYEFELEGDDVNAILDTDGEFTAATVRSFAIDLFESGAVDIQPDGYAVSIDFDFGNPDDVADVLRAALPETEDNPT
jgi:hypothetical protein